VRKSNDNSSDANTSNVMVYYTLPQSAALFQGGKKNRNLFTCIVVDNTSPEFPTLFTEVSRVPSCPSDDTWKSSFSSLLMHSNFDC